jgi:SAM-dependent methyltransferase
MQESGAIIDLSQWLQTPAGRYVLEWEQGHLDKIVADLFGYHALQIGMPELDALRANRMPHRWVATDQVNLDRTQPSEEALPRCAVALRCELTDLPFDSQSLDLVILPHALELAADPHQTLREVERVLVPEGRVVVLGFNPTSLWGLSQRLGHLRGWVRPGRAPGLFLPAKGEFLGYRRLRDWLRLLSFEVESGRLGCYRPPLRSARWMARTGWMDAAGERWWPVFGAVYFVVAVKRVQGMRLVGMAKSPKKMAAAAPVVAVSHQQGLKKGQA